VWRWLVPLVLVVLAVALGVALRLPKQQGVVSAVAGEAALPIDAGPSDEEVLASSLARLERAKREAQAAMLAERTPSAARTLRGQAPDVGSELPTSIAISDAGLQPASSAELESVASLVARRELPEAVERVHFLFRARSPSAVPALLLVTKDAESRVQSGGAASVETVAARLRELPTSDAAVRAPLSRLLGALAVASTKAAHYERAKDEARQALELEESNAAAYFALGEFQFQDNDLVGALDTWERGLRMNPGDRALAGRLERGRREAAQVGGLERTASEHFVVSFDGRTDVSGARATLETMEAAYRAVGAIFQLYPEGPIPLVLYPNKTFEQQGHASWTVGVYDGKIRVPAEGAAAQARAYQGTLFHEYAHALFHRATRGVPAPHWLNEGLASFAGLRGDPGPAVTCPAGHAFPLTGLSAAFGRLDRRSAHWAYLEGRHAVERLVERHGEEGIRTLLREVASQGDYRRGFERAFGEDPDEFARRFDAEAAH
jgi:tetratricopeptide (TPR) repeat protein